jgi:hypothetical protein
VCASFGVYTLNSDATTSGEAQGSAWLGYLHDYPDYRTQGETLDDLIDHLNDLSSDLASAEPDPAS